MLLRGLWMDMTSKALDIHMRTDANNLVTTAQTTHLPEQEETIHMIQMLRHEACSGDILDLAHIVTQYMMADCMTKESAQPDNLVKAVTSGILPDADKHMPFREMMKGKHKAYFMNWLCKHISNVHTVHSFLGGEVWQDIQKHFGSLSERLRK